MAAAAAAGTMVQVGSSQQASPRQSQAVPEASSVVFGGWRSSTSCQGQLSACSTNHGEADTGLCPAHPSTLVAPFQVRLSTHSPGHDDAVPGVKMAQHSTVAMPCQAQMLAQSIGCEESHPSNSPVKVSTRSGREVVKIGFGRVPDSYRCEVSVLKASFPPLLDASDFRSSLRFSSLAQESLEVASPFPLVFSIPGQDALERNLLHVRIMPRELGRVTTEFETYLCLFPLTARADIGQRQVVTLGMVPFGSGASPRAICRHCSAADSASETLHTHMPLVTVACFVSGCPAREDEAKDGAHAAASLQAEAKTDAMSPGQIPIPAVAYKALSAPIVPVATDVGEVERGPQGNASLREDLEKARNELRMQQALMKFQEKRLRSFEAAQSDVVARAQEGLPTARATDVQVQLEQLAATVRRQQLEIADLRDQLRSQGAIEPHSQQTQAQIHPPQDRALVEAQQARARTQDELEVRNRRVRELEIALQHRDRQLDMIPDAVDMILRSPRPALGDAEPAGVGGSAGRGGR